MKGVPSAVERSDRKAAIKRLRLLSFTQKSNIETFRAKIEKEFDEPILPNKVEMETRDFGGVKCRVLSPELYAKHKVIFYIHGGSFVGGSAASYCGFCARVAHKTLCRVVVVDFALAPHAFPASLKDAQSAFCALFAEEQVAVMLDGHLGGFDTDSGGGHKEMPKIVVMADGSGASIAYSLISTLKDKYKECLHQVVFISPWLDISDSSMVLQAKGGRDEVLSAETVRKASAMYAKDENRNSALCSLPKCASTSLSSWPHVFIQMGEKEILLEDVKRATDMLTNQGVKCTLDVWPRMMHLFQLSNDLVRECRLAIDRIGKEVRGEEECTAGGVLDASVHSERTPSMGTDTIIQGDASILGGQVFFNAPPLEESI